MASDKPDVPEQWRLWEQIILSGQMDLDEVQKLLADEPEFSRWYQFRSDKRNGKDNAS